MAGDKPTDGSQADESQANKNMDVDIVRQETIDDGRVAREKKRIGTYASAAVIAVVLAIAALALPLSDDANTRDWAKQSLTLLLGAAIGYLFSKRMEDD